MMACSISQTHPSIVTVAIKQVEYINALAAFAGPHTIKYKPKGTEMDKQVTAAVVLIGTKSHLPRSQVHAALLTHAVCVES